MSHDEDNCGLCAQDRRAQWLSTTPREARLRRGMVGTYEGQSALVHDQHPVSGVSRPGLVWLECEVVWSHGAAEGFWAAPSEYDEVL